MVDQRFHRRSFPGYRPKRLVAKLCLAVGALLVLGAIVAVLPGIDHVASGMSLVAISVVQGILALVFAALLIAIAPELGRPVAMTFDDPPRLGDDLGSVVHWGVVLAAMIITHRGLSPIVTVLLGDWVVVFDLVFLVATIPLVLIVAFRLYFSLDPLANRLADTREREPGTAL